MIGLFDMCGSCDEFYVPSEWSHQLISGSSDPACHNAAYMDHHNTGDGTYLSDGSFAKRTCSHASNPPTGIRPVGTL